MYSCLLASPLHATHTCIDTSICVACVHRMHHPLNLLSLLPIRSFTLRWTIDVYGAPGTLYEGEVFALQVDFATNYPLEAPQVGVAAQRAVQTRPTSSAALLMQGYEHCSLQSSLGPVPGSRGWCTAQSAALGYKELLHIRVASHFCTGWD